MKPERAKAAMKICPSCLQQYSAMPALSRKDNKTEICPICATQEAMDDSAGLLSKELQEEVLQAVRKSYNDNGIGVPMPKGSVVHVPV